MLAAHLNELGVQQQPEAPPRNNRGGSKSMGANNNVAATPGSASNHTPSSNVNNQMPPTGNILDPLIDSESDSEPEDNGRGRNDGTLLASDPPKPL